MRKQMVSWLAALLGVEVYIDGVRRGALSVSEAQGDSS